MKYDAVLLAIQQFSIAIGFGAGNKLNIGQWDQVNKPTFGFNSFQGDAFGSNDGKEVLTANYTIVTIYCDHQNITSGMRLFFNETEKSVLQVAGSTSNTLTVNGTFDVGDVDSGGFPMRGDICEVYLNSGLMSDSLRGELIAFLKTKWSIS